MHDDDDPPRLTRCFRGHATPAHKTFCDLCGASLSERPADEVVPSGRRKLLRRIR